MMKLFYSRCVFCLNNRFFPMTLSGSGQGAKNISELSKRFGSTGSLQQSIYGSGYRIFPAAELKTRKGPLVNWQPLREI